MPYDTHSKDADIMKISVIGAAGGIGQCLSLLLMSQLTGSLLDGSQFPSKRIHFALYDINVDAINGLVADLSHINTPVTVSGYSPCEKDSLKKCLSNCHLVIIVAGIPRKLGMTREDLLETNVEIMSHCANSIAEFCDLSKVFILVISNPINILVPVLVEQLSRFSEGKHFDIRRRVFGITNLDSVRSSAFLHKLMVDTHKLVRPNMMPTVPVIGGHSGTTILPLFSLASPSVSLSTNETKCLVHHVQYGGDEIVKAKKGMGSATMSMAHAAKEIVFDFIELLIGTKNIIEGTYYVSLIDDSGEPLFPSAAKLLRLIDNCPYFAIPCSISREEGTNSVDYKIIYEMDSYEHENMLPDCLSGLKDTLEMAKNIRSGI
ncbi:CPA_1a_G0016920.mRNA.1.CDS.1 [Saccharomyces cerevisiae]|nr:CPA_1a_G0016920.mRNA.1.CDS.1 [Saccharomyces cerevisiae]CAI7275118.1 CPA_1a_G0016920.mRNA.1.CDS.1 [Saccharomyces cerevisiae]